MCSNYNVSARRQDFDDYDIKLPESFEPIDKRFFPKDLAPVLVKDSDAKLRLVGMQFSLIPSWSKQPKVKFATHNARLETVMQKPSFKIPFKQYHCIVPMTGFFESVREGDFAGNVIQFKPKESTLLFAAGIFDIWIDPENGKKLHSFTILTSDPSQFILDNGHDRTPIFLNYDDAKTWLDLLNKGDQMKEFLNTKLIHPGLTIEVDRPLKAGWDR